MKKGADKKSKKLDWRRIIYLILGWILVFLGLAYLLSSLVRITGFVISEETSRPANGIIGSLFFIGGLFVLSRVNRRRKGQAAMEFLMTYGWAILGAIIVIGVLVSIGVFNQEGNGVNILSSPFLLEGSQVDEDGVSFELTNLGSDRITITGIRTENMKGGGSCADSSEPVIIPSGGKSTVDLSCVGFEVGKSVSGNLIVTYTKAGSSLAQIANGVFGAIVVSGSIGGVGGDVGANPPVISFVSINSDENVEYSINTDSPVLLVTTGENADCRWDLSDGSYSDMANDCTGDGGMSHSCQVSDLEDGVHVSCMDEEGNANEDLNNLDVSGEVDLSTPIQSGHNPPSGSEIGSTSINVAFVTDEPAYCRWALSDGSYSEMQNDCNDLGTSHGCSVVGMVSGDNLLYITCRDDTNEVPNEDPSGVLLVYTVDVGFG